MRDWPKAVVPTYRSAVFLDRDGTLNEDTHYPHHLEELQIPPHVLPGMRELATLPVQIIVVSNQAGIAKGLFTVAEMSDFNEELRRRIIAEAGRIDGFYYCPHLEPADLPPGVAACSCSKPNPGLLLEAAEDFDLELENCFLIGDKNSDVAAGQAAGAISILVRTGKAGRDGYRLARPPDANVANLQDAARYVGERLSATVRT